jgi:protoporphyrinogen oxidase
VLGINKPKISDYHFLYLPQEDILPYRITFPMNCSEKMTPPNMSSICAEYSYIGDEKLADTEIIEKTIEDLMRIGIIKDKDDVIFREMLELNPAYAIFDFNREKNLGLIEDYLKENNIHSIGPFGKCQHSSMEEAMLGGREMASKL